MHTWLAATTLDSTDVAAYSPKVYCVLCVGHRKDTKLSKT